MTTDFRALCAELSDALRNAIRVVYHEDGTQHISTAMPILRRARAALADEPAAGEPASVTGQFMPTDAELLCIAAEEIDGYGNGINPGDYEPSTEMAVEAYGSELCAYARAVLARWGNPAPQPVPVSERLPEAKDCDDQKRCWWLVHQSWPCLYLMKADSGLAAAVATHWLPAHALPIPHQQENAND